MTKAILPTVRVSRTFDAPRDRVFRAFTDPAAIPRWFAGKDEVTEVAAQELREGGRFSYRGTFSGGRWEVSGVYREVRPPERLVFTWTETLPGAPDAGETLVTVVFREDGGRTTIEVTHENDVVESSRLGHEKGWASCFERLAEVTGDR